MTRRGDHQAAALLAALAQEPQARLVRDGAAYRVDAAGRKSGHTIPAPLVRRLLAGGLLVAAQGGDLAASSAATAWLKRRAGGGLPFLAQHLPIERKRLAGDGETVHLNAAESPIAMLARRNDAAGKPWLGADAVEAAERLRRDFEVGGLQPRITANWSAAVNTARRTDAAGLTELTDAAIAARIRFARAMNAVGPEFSGLLADICCFLKGVETVERERSWPARSGKLVLRLALGALARHYGLASAASGPSESAGMRSWGADDYRPSAR